MGEIIEQRRFKMQKKFAFRIAEYKKQAEGAGQIMKCILRLPEKSAQFSSFFQQPLALGNKFFVLDARYERGRAGFIFRR